MKQHEKWYQRGWVREIAVILFFVIVAVAYFTPAAFEGRVLFQADGAAASGTGQDVVQYEKETGYRSLWTGSLFGGMPMYQISPSYPSAEGIKAMQNLYRLRLPWINFLPGDSYLIFMMLLGFYIFMRSWSCQRLLSAGGALLWAFSSYFIILIDAGHLWKLLTLAYIPPTVAGLVLAFHRRKYWLGFLVTGLFSALQIYSNHIQMSYYFCFLILAMVIAWAVEAGRKGAWSAFGKAFVAVLGGALVGIAINGTSLYHTYEYSKETMRGGREITVLDDPDAQESNSKGLDKEYITQWSYGIDEMLTFLIPDAKGGSSGQIGMTEPALSKASYGSRNFVASQNRYWGDQPFTAGPVYVGAFVLFLAIFGIFVARGPMKWALLIATVLTVMLSWGHHFMWLTSLFIDYMPLYDKFRTPSSILVVAEMTVVLFALWGLVLIAKDPQILQRERTPLIISLVLTGGVALLMWLVPTAGGALMSEMERQAYAQYLVQYPDLAPVLNDLEKVRGAILSSDALRSLLFILAGCLLLYLFYKQKIKRELMVALVLGLSFVDLWSVDKRYVNDSKYHKASNVAMAVSRVSPIDAIILEDNQGAHRVMNLTVNTYNDATTSYHHRSVGGYHAAKLQRYQDLIEGYLSQMDMNVLRALNTKYYILPDSVQGQQLHIDEGAYGAAWFVRKVKQVSDANEEFMSLGKVSLAETAVIAPPFTQELVEDTLSKDSLAQITLVSYAPDELHYRSTNRHDGVAVFSEIYYPHGWHATIDGVESDILRVNYLLRGLMIPAGEHEIVFRFDPKSVHRTETIAWAANALLLIVFLGLMIPVVRTKVARPRQ
ncbi:MAG: hypothetical protein Q4D93_04610 [Porphyromonas sp.]|nr:hypothetical protein [Porphyromonas sp.]